MLFVILIFCGLIAGTVAGLFGVGGGILFTPILFILFSSVGLENPATWAIATSLFCTFTASISSSIQQRSEKNFYWKQGVIVGLFGTIGVFAGKQVVTSPYYTEDVFVALFSILLVFVAILFFRRRKNDITLLVTKKTISIPKAVGAGTTGGFIAALAGVGGGIVLVPIMNLAYKLRLKKAVSISSMAIVLISLSGWMQFALLAGQPDGITPFTLGYVDFGSGLPLIIGAFTGGFAGVRIGHSVSQLAIQIGFGILILTIAALMIIQLFN
ncbi:MAG: sulfite exporter TauE/SafE family protein [Balneolaceae bacterium]|nr:MAG: sulfite exporter TauE/SafE family protein [Balneolaceae bacterium]